MDTIKFLQTFAFPLSTSSQPADLFNALGLSPLRSCMMRLYKENRPGGGATVISGHLENWSAWHKQIELPDRNLGPVKQSLSSEGSLSYSCTRKALLCNSAIYGKTVECKCWNRLVHAAPSLRLR